MFLNTRPAPSKVEPWQGQKKPPGQSAGRLGLLPPWGTLVVNVLGSLTMGALYILLATRTHLSPLLLTGVLGGFTTFSAFSLDALKLWQSGQTPQALAYVAASVLLSLAAVALGAALTKGALA